jgi:phage terminase small subunit
MRELTPRRQKFALACGAGLPAGDAAVLAGYLPKSASRIGHRLLKVPAVAAAIDAEQQKAEATRRVTGKYDLARVLQDIDDCLAVARTTNDARSMTALLRMRLDLLPAVPNAKNVDNGSIYD